MAAEKQMKKKERKEKQSVCRCLKTPLLIQTAERAATERETKVSEACLTFAVGVVVPQRAEAILAHAAASRLQVDAVGVLHAAVALRAEVMTCRRRGDEKVELHGGKSRGGGLGVHHIINSFLLIY